MRLETGEGKSGLVRTMKYFNGNKKTKTPLSEIKKIVMSHFMTTLGSSIKQVNGFGIKIDKIIKMHSLFSISSSSTDLDSNGAFMLAKWDPRCGTE